MSDVIFRGKPKAGTGGNHEMPTWVIVLSVASFVFFACVLGIADTNKKPLKDFEYEKDGMYCHEKTVCCNAADPSTCTSFESCR